MGVFDVFARASEPDISLADLAEQTTADPLLLSRFLRVLVDGEFLKETGPSRYAALPLAKVFTTGSPFSAAITHFEIDTEVVSRLPAYFEARGYNNPSDAYDGPFQYTIGTRQHYFDWLAQRPEAQAAFNTVMQLNVRNRGEEWFELYPVAERLRSATDRSSVLIVDIGGGIGHDLTAFTTRYTDLPGRLVLQDLPAVISTIPTDPPLPSHIEVMPHDFFQPQPIQGARAYYMRTVLHDWPDIEAEKILSNIVAAMDTQSVLLISEKVMPASNAPAGLVQADISMMVQFSALERTKQQWIVLLEKVGLEVTGCWEPKEVGDGRRTLFEARLLK